MFRNGNSELPDVDTDDLTLRVRNHPEVKQLREDLGERREELEKLQRERREAGVRRQELRDKFEEALDADTDTDPRDVREEILDLEERLDGFEERRTTLQADIASLEQEINEAAEQAREEISAEVSEPLRQLHQAYAHHLQQALKAHLKLREFDALDRAHQRVPGLPDGERHVERPDLPVDEPIFGMSLVQALKQLRALRRDSFNIDEDLLDQLNEQVHA